MKKYGLAFLMGLVSIAGSAQNNSSENTLLWKISGNGLAKPSYLFGTIHMICKKDAVLSDSLKEVIRTSDKVYMEVDMDNLFEMMGALKTMKMRGDTTLADLLTKEEYQKVKAYFESKQTQLPFSMLESYKPMLAQSVLMESSSFCDEMAVMEMVIMEEAKANKKEIKGLETLAYQSSIFDSIPYKLQAQLLVKSTDTTNGNDSDAEFEKMMDAYKKQNLKELDQMMNSNGYDEIPNFRKLLLDNRNTNWVNKLKGLMGEKKLLIAVGAGHLPGEMGVINLLRKEGYKVTPVKNNMRSERII
jgi:uncharacterized protein